MASVRRLHLSLKKKIEVIDKEKKNPTMSGCSLGEFFGCGKTQISDIVKSLLPPLCCVQISDLVCLSTQKLMMLVPASVL